MVAALWYYRQLREEKIWKNSYVINEKWLQTWQYNQILQLSVP